MRRPSLFALATFAGLTLFSVASQAQSVTVYGRVVMSVNKIETGNVSRLTELRDNASRLGFRGVEDMGGGLRALFGLEMGLNADTGSLTDPVYRNSYVGLRGDWGTVALGRLDSANPTGSPLYSQIIAITNFAPNDAGATATSTAMQNARNRTSNSMGYASPTWGGFNVRARYYYRGAGTVAQAEDAARSFDLGLNYQIGGLKAAVGFAKDTRDGGLAANEFDDKWQAGANYEFMKGLELYALGGVDTFNATANRRHDVQYWIVGTAFTQGQHKVVLNLMERDVQTSLTAVRKRYQVSYQYLLSKRTDLQAFFDNDDIDSTRSNVRVRAIGMGVRHNF